MDTNSIPAVEVEVEMSPVIKSIADGAREQASLHSLSESLFKSLMAFIPGLGQSDDAITDEVRAELRKGYELFWYQKNGSKYYVAVDNNWVECKTEAEMLSHKKADKFILDVHTAFGYSAQAFGALKNEEPKKYALVTETRTKFNKYCSNRINELKSQAKKIYNEMHGIQRERAGTSAFGDWLMTGDKSALATMRQRCVNAKARGNDETADLAKLDKALAAFKTAWNK
jgi:hypothetical protein